MPALFPSHQGLILPLWRRFPRHLDGVALSVGAAMPDIVDFGAWPIRRELGQWIGHSLLGVALLCVPAGLVLAFAARRTIPARFLARLDDGTPRTLARDAGSLAVGALSHVFFDLVSHCSFQVLWPWTPGDIFPAWWCRPWLSVPVFVYKEPYPLAPHTIVWAVLTLVGAALFFRCLLPRSAKRP